MPLAKRSGAAVWLPAVGWRMCSVGRCYPPGGDPNIARSNGEAGNVAVRLRGLHAFASVSYHLNFPKSGVEPADDPQLCSPYGLKRPATATGTGSVGSNPRTPKGQMG